MKCVRCKINKSILEEKICKKCLEELRRKFKIPSDVDPLDFYDVQVLIRDYENAH